MRRHSTLGHRIEQVLEFYTTCGDADISTQGHIVMLLSQRTWRAASATVCVKGYSHTWQLPGVKLLKRSTQAQVDLPREINNLKGEDCNAFLQYA